MTVRRPDTASGRGAQERFPGRLGALLAMPTVIIAAVAVLAAAGVAPRSGELVGVGTSEVRPAHAGSARGPAAVAAVLVAAGTSTFSIRGSMTGLYPGATEPLVLTIANPFAFAIVVTSIQATVGNASAACPASDATVSPFAGHLGLAAHASAQAALTISLAHAAPDGCQGAIFPLTYLGQAVKP